MSTEPLVKEIERAFPDRPFTIELWDESHTQAVQTWRLKQARIIKHVSGPFNAKGTDVAMEECTLAFERLEMA